MGAPGKAGGTPLSCRRCGREFMAASRVCPYCGVFAGREEPETARSVPAYFYGEDAQAEVRPQPPGTGASRRRPRSRRRQQPKARKPRRLMVNWALLTVTLLALAFFGVVGGFLYLKLSPGGQLYLARMGRDANADAFWALGTELLDRGSIARAIEAYETALQKQPEREDLTDKLFLLAEAYEAGALSASAEAVYTRIYRELDPASIPAYRSVLRLMLAEDRLFEATTLMREAYEKTGDEGFLASRAALVPKPPEADLSGGRYPLNRSVSFVSPQGYEVYYARGEEALPEEGTLFTEPILLTEGTHEFRAVCVSSELISDEMQVRYVISLPVPVAPKATLAAGEYDRRQRVSLRNLDTDSKVEMYYTIDGTTPTRDSPRYEGVPIALPGGRINLRAISINSYGKVSNELNIFYRVNIPFERYFRMEDQFRDVTLLKTTRDAFLARYGEPTGRKEVEDPAMPGPREELAYPWGTARFSGEGNGALLYHLRTEDPSMTGPRGAKAGMAMEEVTRRFRDMGQLPNARGDRGIYYDLNEGYAHYEVLSDDPMEGTLEYMHLVPGEEGGTVIFRCEIRGGRVAALSLGYMTQKLSNYR